MSDIQFPIKLNAEVFLRPFKLTDIASIAAEANNIKIASNLNEGFPHPYSINDAKDFILRRHSENPELVLAIEVEGKAVGAIGLFLQQNVHRKNAEIGYWLGEKYWNRGIGTSALKAMIQYAFTNFDLLRLFARPFPFNIASQKILEKCGFRLEAIIKNGLFKDGIVYDEWIYSLLKSDLNEEFSGKSNG